jgi:hypothetical protein
MNRRWVVGILVALVVVAGAVALGGFAYSAGLAQGAIQSGQLPAAPQGAPYVYPYGVPFYHYAPWFGPWGFGFGLLRCLFPLLGILLVFALLRGFAWRRHWGYPGGPGHVPPMMEEWHRRMHGEGADAGAPRPEG